MEIHNQSGKKILHGLRDYSNDLWKVKVPLRALKQGTDTGTGPCINALISTRTPKSEFIRFIHLAIGAPTKHALTVAIKNNFLETIPFMTAPNVNKFLLKSVETNKGHQQQQRMHQKIITTSQGQQQLMQQPFSLPEEPVEPLMHRTHVICAAMHQIPPDKSDWAYGDLTGRHHSMPQC